MKKILIAIAIASAFAACKNNSSDDLQTNKVMMTDTTGSYSNSASSDTSTAAQRGAIPVKASVIPPVVHEKAREPVTRSENNTSVNTKTTTQTTTTKKGWSSRAKGAVIGGATGAIGGAIISKHKGTGAVIGGVAGAAGGYIIGNEIDKKKKR